MLHRAKKFDLALEKNHSCSWPLRLIYSSDIFVAFFFFMILFDELSLRGQKLSVALTLSQVQVFDQSIEVHH